MSVVKNPRERDYPQPPLAFLAFKREVLGASGRRMGLRICFHVDGWGKLCYNTLGSLSKEMIKMMKNGF